MVQPAEPGIRRCMKCGWLFVSPDRLRLWKCHDCRSHEEPLPPIREASMHGVLAAFRHYHGSNRDIT